MVGKSPLLMGISSQVGALDISSATLTNISNLTSELMSERLARLMNTFWMASLVPAWRVACHRWSLTPLLVHNESAALKAFTSGFAPHPFAVTPPRGMWV